jgi:hypothetical protein
MHPTKVILRSSPAGLLVITLLLSVGCTDSVPQNQVQSTPDNNAATMAAIKAANAPSKPKQNQGVVKTVKMGGGYTYAMVDIGGDDFWLATTMTALQPGQEIAWQDYAMMANFKSKALNQEFDQILFVDRLIDSAAMAQHRGVVAESMNAAGYSFIRVDENGHSIWLAAPETSIRIGQSIQWQGGTQMRNFTSRSLNRVFDEIIFVSAVRVS